MQETNNQIILTIFIVVGLLIFIGIIMLFIAVYYTNTKKRIIREKEILKVTYEQAILQAQFEIQEQTLRNASQEIHDNIGQVLSYVSLSLDRASGLDAQEMDGIIIESKQLVNQSMNDLRDLSKSFSLDTIVANGLSATIKAEVNRLNKSRLINAVLNITGNSYSIGEHQELVLFRILQEFVNNTLKHSKAKHLIINIDYGTPMLTLKLTDDGVGFNAESMKNQDGSGLRNMTKRAQLIGADITASSESGKGSWVTITLTK